MEHVRLVRGNDASAHGTNFSQRLQASADVVTSAMSQSKATSCGDCKLTAAVEHLLFHSHCLCLVENKGGGLLTFTWVTVLAT